MRTFRAFIAALLVPTFIFAQGRTFSPTLRATSSVPLSIAQVDGNFSGISGIANGAARTYTAASQAAMLALNPVPQQGDFCERSDTSTLFLFLGGDPTNIANWINTITSAVPTSRTISTTAGQLTGGGALSSNLTLGLATTAVSAASYGSQTQVPGYTVDAYGRLTAAANTTIGYLPTGTGAVNQTMAGKFQRIVDVMDFGAVGDGVTDDSAAIQAAVDADKGGVIVFPQGKTFLAAGTLLDGSAYNGTTLRIEGTYLLKASGGSTNFQSACWGGIILHSVDSVVIDCPGTLNGNRANQPNSVYEFSVVLAGATNTRVPRANLAELRGDGFYVATATLGASSTNSSNFVVGTVFGYNSADDGRNLISIISCAGVTIGSVTSYQIGGTVNSTRQPGGLDIEPSAVTDSVSDVVIGACNVISAGTSGLQVAGKSISGVDANMDWNISRVTIRDFAVRGTAGAGLSGAPNFSRVSNLNVAGQTNRANAGNGVNLDYLNVVTASLDVSGCSIAVIAGIAGYVYDFNVKLNIPNYTTSGLEAVGVARGRFSGRIYGATNSSTTRAIYTTTNARTLSPSQPSVIYGIDAPFDGNNTNAFRNDHTNTVTFGTGTRIENCDFTGYASTTLQVDTFAQIPSVNVQGRNYSTAMPSTGVWVQGDFAQKSNTAAADGQGNTLIGWGRVTTGTANVLGTDWVAEYAHTTSLANAATNATSASPTGTTSTAGVMMGIAGTITPTNTGRVTFSISGQMANSTINDGATIQLRTGTGSAPANAAALTGTTRGLSQTHTSLVAADTSGFSVTFTVTGLTLGTAVWYDISLAAVTGGTATVTGVTANAVEN